MGEKKKSNCNNPCMSSLQLLPLIVWESKILSHTHSEWLLDKIGPLWLEHQSWTKKEKENISWIDVTNWMASKIDLVEETQMKDVTKLIWENNYKEQSD